MTHLLWNITDLPFMKFGQFNMYKCHLQGKIVSKPICVGLVFVAFHFDYVSPFDSAQDKLREASGIKAERRDSSLRY